MHKFQVLSGNGNKKQRDQQRRADCESTYRAMIEAAVAQGWLKEEIALEMADVAEDYIMALASQANRRNA